MGRKSTLSQTPENLAANFVESLKAESLPVTPQDSSLWKRMKSLKSLKSSNVQQAISSYSLDQLTSIRDYLESQIELKTESEDVAVSKKVPAGASDIGEIEPVANLTSTEQTISTKDAYVYALYCSMSKCALKASKSKTDDTYGKMIACGTQIVLHEGQKLDFSKLHIRQWNWLTFAVKLQNQNCEDKKLWQWVIQKTQEAYPIAAEKFDEEFYPAAYKIYKYALDNSFLETAVEDDVKEKLVVACVQQYADLDLDSYVKSLDKKALKDKKATLKKAKDLVELEMLELKYQKSLSEQVTLIRTAVNQSTADLQAESFTKKIDALVKVGKTPKRKTDIVKVADIDEKVLKTICSNLERRLLPNDQDLTGGGDSDTASTFSETESVSGEFDASLLERDYIYALYLLAARYQEADKKEEMLSCLTKMNGYDYQQFELSKLKLAAPLDWLKVAEHMRSLDEQASLPWALVIHQLLKQYPISSNHLMKEDFRKVYAVYQYVIDKELFGKEQLEQLNKSLVEASLLRVQTEISAIVQQKENLALLASPAARFSQVSISNHVAFGLNILWTPEQLEVLRCGLDHLLTGEKRQQEKAQYQQGYVSLLIVARHLLTKSTEELDALSVEQESSVDSVKKTIANIEQHLSDLDSLDGLLLSLPKAESLDVVSPETKTAYYSDSAITETKKEVQKSHDAFAVQLLRYLIMLEQFGAYQVGKLETVNIIGDEVRVMTEPQLTQAIRDIGITVYFCKKEKLMDQLNDTQKVDVVTRVFFANDQIAKDFIAGAFASEDLNELYTLLSYLDETQQKQCLSFVAKQNVDCARCLFTNALLYERFQFKELKGVYDELLKAADKCDVSEELRIAFIKYALTKSVALNALSEYFETLTGQTLYDKFVRTNSACAKYLCSTPALLSKMKDAHIHVALEFCQSKKLFSQLSEVLQKQFVKHVFSSEHQDEKVYVSKLFLEDDSAGELARILKSLSDEEAAACLVKVGKRNVKYAQRLFETELLNQRLSFEQVQSVYDDLRATIDLGMSSNMTIAFIQYAREKDKKPEELIAYFQHLDASTLLHEFFNKDFECAEAITRSSGLMKKMVLTENNLLGEVLSAHKEHDLFYVLKFNYWMYLSNNKKGSDKGAMLKTLSSEKLLLIAKYRIEYAEQIFTNYTLLEKLGYQQAKEVLQAIESPSENMQEAFNRFETELKEKEKLKLQRLQSELQQANTKLVEQRAEFTKFLKELDECEKKAEQLAQWEETYHSNGLCLSAILKELSIVKNRESWVFDDHGLGKIRAFVDQNQGVFCGVTEIPVPTYDADNMELKELIVANEKLESLKQRAEGFKEDAKKNIGEMESEKSFSAWQMYQETLKSAKEKIGEQYDEYETKLAEDKKDCERWQTVDEEDVKGSSGLEQEGLERGVKRITKELGLKTIYLMRKKGFVVGDQVVSSYGGSSLFSIYTDQNQGWAEQYNEEKKSPKKPGRLKRFLMRRGFYKEQFERFVTADLQARYDNIFNEIDDLTAGVSQPAQLAEKIEGQVQKFSNISPDFHHYIRGLRLGKLLSAYSVKRENFAELKAFFEDVVNKIAVLNSLEKELKEAQEEETVIRDLVKSLQQDEKTLKDTQERIVARKQKLVEFDQLIEKVKRDKAESSSSELMPVETQKKSKDEEELPVDSVTEVSKATEDATENVAGIAAILALQCVQEAYDQYKANLQQQQVALEQLSVSLFLTMLSTYMQQSLIGLAVVPPDEGLGMRQEIR